MNAPATVGAMLSAAVQVDATRPQLTFYDDLTGERTELSGATLANWVAKTANMIVDDTGGGPGQRAAVGLPPHWQTAAILLGCWSAGLAVVTDAQPADVAFVHADDATPDWPATDRYALNLHPFALPLRTVPDGYADFTSEVRVHGDHFLAPAGLDGSTDALIRPDRVVTHAQLIAEATDRAQQLGITSGRVLINADAYPDVRDWLLAPLATGASIVLCRNTDSDRWSARAETERVTHVLPVDHGGSS